MIHYTNDSKFLGMAFYTNYLQSNRYKQEHAKTVILNRIYVALRHLQRYFDFLFPRIGQQFQRFHDTFANKLGYKPLTRHDGKTPRGNGPTSGRAWINDLWACIVS